MNKCKIPPIGWRCTRAAGHSGPCAAIPDESQINPNPLPEVVEMLKIEFNRIEDACNEDDARGRESFWVCHYRKFQSFLASVLTIAEPPNSPTASVERDSLRSQLESSQAECERLKKLLGELRDVTQSLVKLAEVWTPEFTQTIHNARCVISDAAMQPASAPDHYPEMFAHARQLESELCEALKANARRPAMNGEYDFTPFLDALRVSHSCIMLFRDLVKGYAINTALGVGALETIEKVIPELGVGSDSR